MWQFHRLYCGREVIEYANQYYKVPLFEPLSLRFPDIFRFVELCLCAPYSNATIECFLTTWRL